MKPTYSGHARYQMRIRRVSEVEVEAALSRPYAHRRSDGKLVFVHRSHGRRIMVVIEEGLIPPHAVTVIRVSS